MKYFFFIGILLYLIPACGQEISQGTIGVLERLDEMISENKTQDAINLLQSTVNGESKHTDLAYLYANISGLYVSMDSLHLGKKYLDIATENVNKSESDGARAMLYRAKAFLNSSLHVPDQVVKNALEGLKIPDSSYFALNTKYYLNYLLYRTYSNWRNEEKMTQYINECRRIALEADNDNFLANVNNGFSSIFSARYASSGDKAALDSSFYYLKQSFALGTKDNNNVSSNTFTITCINLANFYLEDTKDPLEKRREKAYFYLEFVEKMLKQGRASSEKWLNVYGIKSGFAKQANNLPMAESYLLQALNLISKSEGTHYRILYMLNQDLASIAKENGDLEAALRYHEHAEVLLKKTFDEQQMLNAQRLEVQFESEKKDQQLVLANQQAEFRKRQNYLYGGIAIAILIASVYMFRSYHFKLRYSVQKEKDLMKEKQEAERNMTIQIKLEQEEQARLKAEQELLELKRHQLEKEALANSLIIEHKNEMLKEIQTKIKSGDSTTIQKLLKEEMLLNADFEDVKLQIQKLHPNFFNWLQEKALQKLTSLDLKYCAYLYLQMNTKQIAQILHVEAQSVRMFKYRLKQKFGLEKEQDLELFLQQIVA